MSDGSGFGGGQVAVSITSIVVGGVVAIVIAVLIIKVIQKRKKKRNNSLVRNNGGVIPTTTLQNSTYSDVIPTTTVVQNSTNVAANPTTTVLPNSSVSWDSENEVTSIERFIFDGERDGLCQRPWQPPCPPVFFPPSSSYSRRPSVFSSSSLDWKQACVANTPAVDGPLKMDYIPPSLVNGKRA